MCYLLYLLFKKFLVEGFFLSFWRLREKKLQKSLIDQNSLFNFSKIQIFKKYFWTFFNDLSQSDLCLQRKKNINLFQNSDLSRVSL